jgi:hypothetical protein
MTNIVVTLVIGFVILATTLISAGVAFWAWGEIFSPTLSQIANTTIPNDTTVNIADTTAKMDMGMYIGIIIVILIPVALIVISLLFERERFENSA